ncbi:aspartate--tRNA ligase [Candidatus Microgenomates bacterium]|nr:aspartate--tRNA ligase [Candidatus Microgenomates bacterium]
MERTLVKDAVNKVGEEVKLCGWVQTRRDHGKIVFFDLRDITGLVQVVLNEEQASDINVEYVVEIVGLVKERPANLVNDKITTGKIEISSESVKVISKSETLPFPIDGEGYEIDEEHRLKYRYLDLRRKRLNENIIFRSKVVNFIRNWLVNEDFIEIETPVLTKATPEGARDFLVPSRMNKGKFYALPQSPQQYKQLLMVAGFERYFQLPHCFRDEDTRKDRQLEFTQLDIEMSFVDQDMILNTTERLFTEMAEHFGYKVLHKPFPRIKYADAMTKYGDDKFDLREEKDSNTLAFAWVVDQPLFEWKKQENRWDATHHPFTAPNPEDLQLLEKGEYERVRSWQHDLVCNGYEIGGGSIRITDPKMQAKIFEIMGHTNEQIQNKFGHLLKAFEFGVPPHGGIAPGIDRLIAVMRNEPTIREIIAFPSSSSGQTSVMDAPSEADPEQLKELGLSVNTKK